jgi:large repetitive protein
MSTITGDANDNILYGTTSDDIIDGLGGDDTIYGGDGDDTIFGGDGNDFIDGGAGSDTIYAGDGDDIVVYDSADDIANIYGGSGTDMILFTNGDWLEFDIAAQGFELIGERYMDGTDEVTDVYDANLFLLEERRLHADGYYTLTTFDYYDLETWSEWIREYDDQGNLINETFIADEGGGSGNTAPEVYAGVTEDLVLVVSGNLFTSYTGPNPVLTSFAGQTLPPTGTITINGLYGTLEIDAAGNYTYTLNNPSVQYFTTDDRIPDIFAFEFNDDNGSYFTDLLVEITGNNDAPIATDNTAMVQKDTIFTDSGNLLTDDDGFGVDYDVENQPIGIIEVNSIAIVPVGDTVITGTYGTLTINGATGAYTYTLDNSNLAVQALDLNETIIDSFIYTITDAAANDTATLYVTILGTESGPQTVPDSALTHEDDTVGVTGNVLANDAGTGLFVSDVNGIAVAAVGETTITGTHGTVTFDTAGNFYYLVDSASATVQALRAGQTLSETFTYTAENSFGTEIANLTISINGANDVAVVGGDDIAEVTEDGGNPPFDLGVLTVYDPDAGESSFIGGSYNGAFGTVQLTAQGSYTYTLDNFHPQVQALPEGATLNDTVTVQTFDGTTHDISVVITGTNDAAVIGGINTAEVTEDSDPLMLTASGALTISDVDAGEALFTAATHNGSYGALTIDAAGNWSYSASNTQTAIQQLGAGDTVTETITITSVDGTPGNIVITINGTNDAAIIGGVDTGAVTEEDDPVTLAATGSLTISDVDAGEAVFTAQTIAGTYGSITVDSAGNWTYLASNTQTAIQQLGEGLTLTDTISVSAIDGTTHDVTVTINGTNDAAVITGDDQGSVTEDSGSPDITDSGVLLVTDVDTGEALFTAATSTGTYGSVTIDATGNWTYAADTSQAAIQALGVGATLIDTVTVTSIDGTAHQIQVVINGANDAAVIAGIDTGNVTEDGGAAETATGTLTISDIDAGENLFTAATSAGAYGSVTIDAAGNWTYTLDNANPAVQALGGGATMNDVVTVSSIDGTAHDITITISGTNDASVIGGDVQANVLEDDTEPVIIPEDPLLPAPPPNIDITDSGILTVTDTDTGEASFVAATIAGAYGVLTIDAAGNWTYTADTTQLVIQQLGTGETLIDTITISTADGTTHQFGAVITGVNDAPVGVYDSTGEVSNTVDTLILISSLLANDYDVEGDSFTLTGIEGQPISPGGQVSVSHGTITMSADGTTLIFSPEIGYVGPTSFTYVVSDGETDGIGTVALQLSAAAIDDTLTIAEDTSGTIDVLQNDGIVPETVTSFVITSAPANGTVVINPDNTVTYTPDADYNGPDQFTYEFTGMQQGLKYQFFDTVPNNNSVFNIPKGGEEAAGTIQNFDVRAMALQYQGDHDTYAIRYEGNLYVATAGTYTFRVGSDDGSALLINGSTVVNNDGLHSYQVRSGSVFLTAGYHDIEILYFERTGEDSLTVTIQGPDTAGLQTGLFASGMVGHSMRTDTATVDVTVTPVADAAVIGGTDTGSVTEDSGPSTLVASGALTISDVDSPSEEAFVAGVTGGSYGNLTIDALGNWTYEALNDHPAINALVTGQTLIDTITVSSVDGTTHQITITINGADDAAIIGGVDAGAIQEDGGASQVASGTLTVTDPDAGQAVFTAETIATAYGSLTIDAAGNWTYTLDNASASGSGAGGGATAQDDVTVTSADGTTHVISLTITGSNDAAVITGADTGSVTEDASPLVLTVSGALSVVDVDTGESAFAAGTYTGSLGAVTLDAAGNWTYEADNTQAAIQQLGVGETLTDTISVASFDGTEHNITITINGTNDAPEATELPPISYVSEDAGDTFIGNIFSMYGIVDPDGDDLSVTAIDGTAITYGQPVALAGGGTITVQENGDFSFNPNGDFEYLFNNFQGYSDTSISAAFTISDPSGATIGP